MRAANAASTRAWTEAGCSRTRPNRTAKATAAAGPDGERQMGNLGRMRADEHGEEIAHEAEHSCRRSARPEPTGEHGQKHDGAQRGARRPRRSRDQRSQADTPQSGREGERQRHGLSGRTRIDHRHAGHHRQHRGQQRRANRFSKRQQHGPRAQQRQQRASRRAGRKAARIAGDEPIAPARRRAPGGRGNIQERRVRSQHVSKVGTTTSLHNGSRPGCLTEVASNRFVLTPRSIRVAAWSGAVTFALGTFLLLTEETDRRQTHRRRGSGADRLALAAADPAPDGGDGGPDGPRILDGDWAFHGAQLGPAFRGSGLARRHTSARSPRWGRRSGRRSSRTPSKRRAPSRCPTSSRSRAIRTRAVTRWRPRPST